MRAVMTSADGGVGHNTRGHKYISHVRAIMTSADSADQIVVATASVMLLDRYSRVDMYARHVRGHVRGHACGHACRHACRHVVR